MDEYSRQILEHQRVCNNERCHCRSIKIHDPEAEASLDRKKEKYERKVAEILEWMRSVIDSGVGPNRSYFYHRCHIGSDTQRKDAMDRLKTAYVIGPSHVTVKRGTRGMRYWPIGTDPLADKSIYGGEEQPMGGRPKQDSLAGNTVTLEERRRAEAETRLTVPRDLDCPAEIPEEGTVSWCKYMARQAYNATIKDGPFVDSQGKQRPGETQAYSRTYLKLMRKHGHVEY